MADYLVYWQTYERDLKKFGKDAVNEHWFTRDKHLYKRVKRQEDTLWVVVKAGASFPNEWRLCQKIRVIDKHPKRTRNPGQREYHFIGDPTSRDVFDTTHQGNLESTLHALEFESGTGIRARGSKIGNAIQKYHVLTQADVKKLRRFVRSPLLHEADIKVIDNDLKSPRRTTHTVRRLERDSKAARELKQDYRYMCQICNTTIKLPNRARYAEAHHLQPLGEPHNGKDGKPNIIVVCPQHHAMFDLGVIAIDPISFRVKQWIPGRGEVTSRLKKREHDLDKDALRYAYGIYLERLKASRARDFDTKPG